MITSEIGEALGRARHLSLSRGITHYVLRKPDADPEHEFTASETNTCPDGWRVVVIVEKGRAHFLETRT